MSKPAAIDGSLVDAKNIAVHKTLRLSIDVPVERAQEVIAAFGWPTMASPVPVAIARLVPDTGLKEKLRESVEHEKSKRNWNELSRAQQAGIASNEQRFLTFINEQYRYQCETVDDVAEAIRELCGLHKQGGLITRRELDSDQIAGKQWDDLYSKFQVWFRLAV